MAVRTTVGAWIRLAGRFWLLVTLPFTAGLIAVQVFGIPGWLSPVFVVLYVGLSPGIWLWSFIERAAGLWGMSEWYYQLAFPIGVALLNLVLYVGAVTAAWLVWQPLNRALWRLTADRRPQHASLSILGPTSGGEQAAEQGIRPDERHPS